MRQLF